jgi:hypothetical protein
MRAGTQNVRSSGQTGSDRHVVKPTRMTQLGHPHRSTAARYFALAISILVLGIVAEFGGDLRGCPRGQRKDLPNRAAMSVGKFQENPCLRQGLPLIDAIPSRAGSSKIERTETTNTCLISPTISLAFEFKGR